MKKFVVGHCLHNHFTIEHWWFVRDEEINKKKLMFDIIYLAILNWGNRLYK